MNARKIKSRKKGSAIAEFGPSLFILLVIIFFPMLDVLAILFQYCLGWYANFVTCRELSVRNSADATQVIQEVYDNLKLTGIPAFLGVKNLQDLDSSNPAPVFTKASNGVPGMVTCTTKMKAQPFITIPWFQPIPGLNSTMEITFVSQRPREVTQ